MPLPEDPTAARLAALLDELFGVPADVLEPSTPLQDGLQLDSLAVVELQVAVEDAFEVRLAPDDTEDVTTVGDLLAAIDRVLEREGRGAA
jgi:acyl carrier protein